MIINKYHHNQHQNIIMLIIKHSLNSHQNQDFQLL